MHLLILWGRAVFAKQDWEMCEINTNIRKRCRGSRGNTARRESESRPARRTGGHKGSSLAIKLHHSSACPWYGLSYIFVCAPSGVFSGIIGWLPYRPSLKSLVTESQFRCQDDATAVRLPNLGFCEIVTYRRCFGYSTRKSVKC